MIELGLVLILLSSQQKTSHSLEDEQHTTILTTKEEEQLVYVGDCWQRYDVCAATVAGGRVEGVTDFSSYSHLIEGIHGLKYTVLKDDSDVGDSLRHLGQWELPFQTLVEECMMMRNTPFATTGSLWLDIGSNVGVWSMFMSRIVGPMGTVMSFEPQLELQYHHAANILLNSIENTILVHAFVSNSTEYSEIFPVLRDWRMKINYGAMSKHDLEHSRSVESAVDNPTPTQQHHRHYKVQNARLDDLYVKGIISKCPSFMKLDIEGGELEALIGGRLLLQQCFPVLFIEAECSWLLRSIVGLLDTIGNNNTSFPCTHYHPLTQLSLAIFTVNIVGYVVAWVILPHVDIDTTHMGRFIPKTYKNFVQTYSSRNLLAVPRSDLTLVKYVYAHSKLEVIHVQAERGINPNTWFSLHEREVKVCPENANFLCFLWRRDQGGDTYNSTTNEFKCGKNVIEHHEVFYYETLGPLQRPPSLWV